MSLCPYDLLTCQRIKKAYRRKALELHPDRNYGDVENTTRLFAEVQSAYEVLSDPQERAWYDSHRYTRGSADAEEYYQRDVKVTTAEDLTEMCLNRYAFSDFSDSPSGFYATVREVFDRLAMEEKVACELQDLEPSIHPSFGSAQDTYEETVKPFYSVWTNFATQKNFSWVDLYHYADAMDRRTRRAMDKENKRFRDEAIREFNEAVRFLAAFVRNRDPRYKPVVQSDWERHQQMRQRSAAQAAQARAANHAKLAKDSIPDWARTKHADDEQMIASSESEAEAVFECVVCKKSFKSENQYSAHEKSKKHFKAVQIIKRDMVQEDVQLWGGLEEAKTQLETAGGLDAADPVPSLQASVVEKLDLDIPEEEVGEKANDSGRSSESNDNKVEPTGGMKPEQESSTGTDDEYASRDEVEKRVAGSQETYSEATKGDRNSGRASPLLNCPYEPKRLGKAKEKKAKKAARQATENGQAKLKCVTCEASFPSRTKLFNHIKDFGHAQRPEDSAMRKKKH